MSAVKAAAATTSPAFRSWLLYGALGTGIVYGFVRDASLSRAATVRREKQAKEELEAKFLAAREAYAASKNATSAPPAHAAPSLSSSGLDPSISDPESPNFDPEKLILAWEATNEAAGSKPGKAH